MPKRRRFPAVLSRSMVAAFLIIIALAGIAYAADGDLDPSFGNGGIASADFPYPMEGIGYSTAVQADSKIVVVGQVRDGGGFAVSRLNPDGSADNSFGYMGSVRTTFFGGAAAGSMVIQPDGKIVAAGYYDPDVLQYALARYNPDGSLDTSFGISGTVKGNVTDGSLINSMRLLPGGKILVAGTTDTSGNRMWIARLNSNGSPDTTFSQDGMNSVFCNQLVDNNSTCEGFALTVQPDGKALVGGTLRRYEQNGYSFYFAIARFTSSGDLDTSFDSDGLVTTEFLGNDRVFSLAVTADNKILAVGNACCDGGGLAMARYHNNGTPDLDFGTAGKRIHSNMSAGYDLLPQPGGKLVVPGLVYNPASAPDFDAPVAGFSFDTHEKEKEQAKGPDSPSATRNFALFRFDSAGNLDPAFGTNGTASLDFGGDRSYAYGVAATPDGKLVGAGTLFGTISGPKPRYRFAVARYSSNGQPDSSFDGDGKRTLSPLANRSSVSSLAVQSDDKVVALAELGTSYQESGQLFETTYGVLRYNVNGTRDSTFGVSGAATYSSTGNFDHVALQSTGKIILGGTMNGRPAAVRFNSNGTFDSNFGDGGLATISPVIQWHSVTDMAVQPDDKLIVLSYFGVGSYGQHDIALTRFNANGTLDTSFDGDGVVTGDFGNIDKANALVLQGDGKIVVAGEIYKESTTADREVLSVIRYNADGSVDTTFGDSGVVRLTQIEGKSGTDSVALTPDGHIVVSGSYFVSNYSEGLLVELNANGTLEPSFGTEGIAYIDTAWYNLVVQHDGKLVVSSAPYVGTPAMVTRYLPDGSLDSSFGSGGTASVAQFTIADLKLQRDGKILAGGTYTASPNRITGVARLMGGPPAVTPDEVRFQDVPPESPFYTYISCMAGRNIISGYPCGGLGEPCGTGNDPYFRPNNSMTRGQVSKIVANAAGYNDTPTGQTFQDVPPDSPFYAFIERMSSRSIISGYACGGPGEECVAPDNRPYFRPAKNVSRGQLTKIVSNARGYSDTPAAQTFEDVTPSNAFYLFVERLVSRGVMSGYACGGPGEPCQAGNRAYFRPGMDVTRGQASKIVGNSFFPNCQSAASAR
ncbi:MAG: S-layer homology domain-containing protein [Chloroflexota bacterium]|nr:S-layer homology domain-containing protein [Chloroflexota bacterium]MDQ5867173.1 S-layer homology domain-containing protein [Chloroflexota bacterium]